MQWKNGLRCAINLLAVLCLLCFADTVYAAPDAQWRGDNRDGIYQETGLLKTWPEGGPKKIWSQKGIGHGWSSVVASDDMLFVTGSQDTMDYISALSKDGEMQWQIPFARAWVESFPDARSTPTLEDGKIYLISSLGTVLRIDVVSSQVDWQRDAHAQFEGDWGIWGTAESPLLIGDKVIYTPGGSKTMVVALDKNTGETVWQSESLNDKSAYASPILVDYAGKQMIVGVSASYVYGVDAKDGAFLWTYRYADLDPPDRGGDINNITPLYYDGQIYVTSGYNHVGAMLKLNEDASGVTLVWKNDVLDTHHGGVVRIGNYIYGSNWLSNSKGNWCAVNWTTGETMYEHSWISKGSVIYADGMLYCYAEKRGYFALVPPDPKNFTVTSSFQITEGWGRHWSHPMIQDGVLYVRRGDVLMAYQIRQ